MTPPSGTFPVPLHSVLTRHADFRTDGSSPTLLLVILTLAPDPSPTVPNIPCIAQSISCFDTEPSLPVLDVQALTEGEDIIPALAPAFERYNESQLATVKLPGSSQEVGFSFRHRFLKQSES